jgi:hypothetical protein
MTTVELRKKIRSKGTKFYTLKFTEALRELVSKEKINTKKEKMKGKGKKPNSYFIP